MPSLTSQPAAVARAMPHAGDANASARLFALLLNRLLGLPEPVPGTRVNGWFGGFGCRWCHNSLAWFTVVPDSQASLAARAAQLCRDAGAIAVKIHPEAGGMGIQVSAYI
ncbi:hypothetical protein ACU4GI_32670 [Cupriavidus basilensis]